MFKINYSLEKTLCCMTSLFPNLTLAFCNFREGKHYHYSYATPFDISRNLYDQQRDHWIKEKQSRQNVIWDREIAWVIRITGDSRLKQISDLLQTPWYQTKWPFVISPGLWQEILLLKTHCLFHWYECCLLCNCMDFWRCSCRQH